MSLTVMDLKCFLTRQCGIRNHRGRGVRHLPHVRERANKEDWRHLQQIERYDDILHLGLLNTGSLLNNRGKIRCVHMFWNQIVDAWSRASAELDMGRMRTVVKRRILQALSDAEDNPHSTLAGMALGDHLYGTNLDDVSFLKSEQALSTRGSLWTDWKTFCHCLNSFDPCLRFSPLNVRQLVLCSVYLNRVGNR